MKRAKRPAKRKSARNRKAVAVKKKAKKKKKKQGGNVEVVILDPAIPLGEKISLLNRDTGDRICWINLDTVKHEIVFKDGEWPFEGTQKNIVLKPDRMKTRKVRSDADKTQYDYDVVPDVIYDSAEPPPDGPAVVVGGE
jgi:plastocyanin